MRRGPTAPAPRKAFIEVSGTPMVVMALEAIARCPDVEGVVVAVAAEDLAAAERLLTPSRERLRLHGLVTGGRRRQDSVAVAVAAIPRDVDLVAVHDAARPMASPELFARVIGAARRTGAACAALPCNETIKEVDPPPVQGQPIMIRGTVDRSRLWAAQTPQVFKRRRLAEFLAEADRDGTEVTDEAALFDMRGLPVEAVRGEGTNIKITTPDDLVLAEAIAARPGAEKGSAVREDLRVGNGFDIHPLVPGRRLVVCGVDLRAERGAEGHSDADVGAHALVDALLGASALGDIGRLFPDTDPAYKDADSMRLLSTVGSRLLEAGFSPQSVDVTVFLEKPKISPHAADMARGLAEAVGIPLERVSVKAKTMNGLGPVGEGRAVAAQATAVVRGGGRGPVASS